MPSTDKLLLRAKDLVLLVSTIAGLIVGAGKLLVIAREVEESKANIVAIKSTIEPLVANHETRLAVSDERWKVIQQQVREINRKLDGGRRRSDGE